MNLKGRWTHFKPSKLSTYTEDLTKIVSLLKPYLQGKITTHTEVDSLAKKAFRENKTNFHKSLMNSKLIQKRAVKERKRDPITLEFFQFLMNHSETSKAKEFSLFQTKMAALLMWEAGLRCGDTRSISEIQLQNLLEKRYTYILSEKTSEQIPVIVSDAGYSLLKKLMESLDAREFFQKYQYLGGSYQNRYLEELNKGNVGISLIYPKQDYVNRINRWIKKLYQLFYKEDFNNPGKTYHINSHSFRIAFVNSIITQYGIESAQLLIGHKDIRTTQIYSRTHYSIKQRLHMVNARKVYTETDIIE